MQAALCSREIHSNHCGRFIAKMPGPLLHQDTPLLKEIRPPIGPLDSAAAHVPERRFRNLSRGLRRFGTPIPEAAAKAVWTRLKAAPVHVLGHGHVRDDALALAGEQEAVAGKFAGLDNDPLSFLRKRHAEGLSRPQTAFHGVSGHRPNVTFYLAFVNMAKRCRPYSSQDKKAQRKFGR